MSRMAVLYFDRKFDLAQKGGEILGMKLSREQNTSNILHTCKPPVVGHPTGLFKSQWDGNGRVADQPRAKSGVRGIRVAPVGRTEGGPEARVHESTAGRPGRFGEEEYCMQAKTTNL